VRYTALGVQTLCFTIQVLNILYSSLFYRKKRTKFNAMVLAVQATLSGSILAELLMFIINLSGATTPDQRQMASNVVKVVQNVCFDTASTLYLLLIIYRMKILNLHNKKWDMMLTVFVSCVYVASAIIKWINNILKIVSVRIWMNVYSIANTGFPFYVLITDTLISIYMLRNLWLKRRDLIRLMSTETSSVVKSSVGSSLRASQSAEPTTRRESDLGTKDGTIVDSAVKSKMGNAEKDGAESRHSRLSAFNQCVAGLVGLNCVSWIGAFLYMMSFFVIPSGSDSEFLVRCFAGVAPPLHMTFALYYVYALLVFFQDKGKKTRATTQ